MMSKKRYKILIIDDSPEDRATYRRYLGRDVDFIYEIVEADSIENGLGICQKSLPDAILLDYLLPDGDGLFFLELLAQQFEKHPIPLLMLTGQGNETIATRAMKSGAVDYLIKGNLTPDTLHKSVSNAIEQFRLGQKLIERTKQQQLTAEIALRIRQSLNLGDILQTTVNEVRQLLGVDRVIIFQFTPGWGGTVKFESVVDQRWAILSFNIYDPCIGEIYLEPFKQGLVTAKTDIYTANISACHIAFLEKLQVRANLVIPILKNHELWGLIVAHHCTAPREWEDMEINLLGQISSQVGIALQQSELLEQVRKESILIQNLFKTSLDGIVILDEQGKVLDANLSFSQMLGYQPEEVKKLSIFDWDANFSAQELLQLRGNLNSGIVESRYRRKDGSIIDVEISTNLVELPDYKVRFCSCRDITERKQIEESLKQSEARLHLAQLASKSAVWDWYIASNTLFWSPEYYRLYDLDPALEPKYENWLRCIHPDDRERVNRKTLEALEHNIDLRVEFRVILSNQIKWFAGIGQVIRDENNNPLRMIGITLDITEQKQTEIVLQQLNNQLEQRVKIRTKEITLANQELCTVVQDLTILQKKTEDLYNNAPCGYHSLDAEGIIIQINNTELNWLGYNREEVVHKKNFSDFLTPQSLLNFQDNFPQFIQRGYIDNLELQLLNINGLSRWLNINSTAIKDKVGNFLMSRTSLFDITERKQMEEALQKQIRQKHLLSNINQAIRLSLDFNIILNTATSEIRNFLNVDRVVIYQFNADWSGNFIAESVGEDWVKLVDSNVCKLWEDTYLQEEKGGRFKNHETITVNNIYTAGLQSCHIDLLEQFQARAYAIAPIFVNESLWGLLGMYHNATSYNWKIEEIELLEQITGKLSIALQQSQLYSQLQIELQERKQTEAVLREAERRWRSLLENVQLIVVGLDLAGNVNYVNPFFLNLSGYQESEVLGKNWFENFLPFSNQESLKATFLEVLKYNANPYHKSVILTKSKEERLIAWNNTILKDSNGNSISIISIGEDITERQKIEKVKDEFIGIVSHELRTPLSGIQMSLGLLQTGVYAKKPEKAKRMLDIAFNDTKRLVNLVNDILDLERLESGRMTLEKTVCKAIDLMQRAVDSIQAIALQQNIIVKIDTNDVFVWANPDSIIQTLTNLLSNALKFSPADSLIHLKAQYEGSYALFQISDHGRGIPDDKLETIFERFQQVDASDSREKGGTGLGLSICRSIIERHGGKIWVESILGEGSTFFFTLPVSEEGDL